MGDYKTVLNRANDEIIIKKSRFIGYAAPVTTEEEAQEFIEQIKKEHRNATHNVPVYLIGEKFDIQRYSDDGEPSGTAGVPMLEMLKNEGITNVAIVATRYFGGIKLGTGGLVRAYTQTAKIALEAAKVVKKCEYERLSVVIPYTFQGAIEHFFNTQDEFIKSEVDYTDVVRFEVFVTSDKKDEFRDKMIQMTSAQAVVSELGNCFLTICDGKILEIL